MHRIFNLIRKNTLGVTTLLILTGSPPVLADHTWGTYHWARQNSFFTLQVVDSVTSFWWSELDAALTEWAAANSVELQITQSQTDETTRLNCPMVTGKIRICNGDYGSTGWLGLATVGVDSGGHVDRGITRINDFYSYSWGSQAMKNHVMCHEVGHLFGLGHTSEDGSSQGTCMDYSSSTSSQWPNTHDYELLDTTVYGHLDSYNSYNASLDDTSGSGGGDDSGSTGGDTGDTGGTTDGEGTGSGDGTTDGGNTKKGRGKKNKDGSDGTTDTGCNAPAGKGCNKNNAGSWISELPPLGVRVAQTRRGEVWVASRKDGGLWIHHVYLAEENDNLNRGAGNDSGGRGHSH